MTQQTIDFEAARARRDQGMTRCADKAERESSGWNDHALALMRHYALAQVLPWTIEQFRPWAYGRGLAKPDDERAFGSTTQRAIRLGYIERVGYAPAASSNGAPKATYALPASRRAA